MYSRLLLSCTLVFLFLACRQRQGDEMNDPSRAVKIEEVTGTPLVFSDSIKPPTIVKAGAPVVVTARQPRGIAFSSDTCHVHEEMTDLGSQLASLRQCWPEGNGSPSIEKVRIEPVIADMGVPETVVAKDMAKKERNPGNFTYFNSMHGLPTSVVRDVIVDAKGNLWIATTGGVTRYDGRNMYTYTRKQGLLVNDITSLLEDRNGDLWLGAYSGALSRFDGKKLMHYQGLESIILFMTLDSKGNIWIGTKEGGVCYFDGKDFNFIGRDQGFRPEIVNSIIENADGNIWIGTNKGLFIYDWNTVCRTVVSKPCDAMVLDSLGHIWFGIENEIYHFDGAAYVKWKPDGCSFKANISQLHFDDSGRLWIGTKGNGLAFFDGKNLSLYDERSGLPGLTIEEIVHDKTGATWIGHSEGICRQNGNLFTYMNEKSPAFRRVHDVFNDSKGGLWFSSEGVQGIMCLKENEIFHYGHAQGFSFSKPWAITEDRTGTLWFAEWSGGLCAFDGKTFSTYTIKQGMLTDSIWNIAADAKGNIWCVTNMGISKLSADRSSFTHYTPENGFGLDYRTLAVGDNNDVWIAGNDKGLFHFRHDPGETIERYSQIGANANSMLIDHNGYLWIGSFENGLVCFDGKRRYHFTPEGMGSKSTFVASAEDAFGNLWFGSFASGLFKLNYKKFEAWKRQVETHSLSNTSWQPADYSDLFMRFDLDEGFLSPGIVGRASVTDKHGNIWIGTFDGIIRVNTSRENVDTTKPVVNITSLKPLNEKVDWLAMKKESQSTIANTVDLGNIEFDSTSSLYHLPLGLRMPYTDNNVNFEFNAVDLSGGKKLVYLYMLEGLEKAWSSPTMNTEVNYGNLTPGHYTFKVKVKNRYGYWSDISAFPFLILPPWWRTWWAYLLYAISLGGIIYLLRRYELHRQQLRHNLELEKVEANKLKELDVVKSRLYTNITHEFRTPLTVILGMADQIEKKPEQPVHERIDLIRRNGRQLLSLVNQMLDLSKIESQQMKIHEIQSDIITYLHYIVESFHSMADTKDIRLKVNHPPGSFMMDYDPVRILQIISNLLSNAIKFTPPEGEILLTVEPNDKLLKIVISDTGIGIHPEQLPHIFSRFYQADSSSTRQGEGTGIGLTLTQELVKLLGGTIRVESQMNKGTTFFIELPVKRTASIQSDQQLSELESNSLTQQSSFAEEVADVESHSHESLPLLLIIEDNADVTRYLVSCLEEQYQVVTAANGQIGIDKALEIIPDIIITDVMMPLKDGFEVCDTLKKDTRTSHIPIIILTAKATVEDRIAGLERGADVYLAKPFHQDELIVQLRNLISTRKKLQERYRQVETPVAQATPDEKIEDTFLLKFRSLIEEELDNAELSIDDICRKMMMSRTQIHRKITALTDRSTSLYIRSIRLAHGKRLLQSTDLNVSEVAYRVGFDDPKYFSRVFQEEFQVAPSEAKGIPL